MLKVVMLFGYICCVILTYIKYEQDNMTDAK